MQLWKQFIKNIWIGWFELNIMQKAANGSYFKDTEIKQSFDLFKFFVVTT